MSGKANRFLDCVAKKTRPVRTAAPYAAIKPFLARLPAQAA
jgi:hypothetical protein